MDPKALCTVFYILFFEGILQFFYECFTVSFTAVLCKLFFSQFFAFFLQFFTKPGLAVEMAGDFGAGDLGGLRSGAASTPHNALVGLPQRRRQRQREDNTLPPRGMGGGVPGAHSP